MAETVGEPKLDHEQSSSKVLKRATLLTRAFVQSPRDTYGRTVMPPKKDPGNGPLQPLHVAATAGDVERLKKLLAESKAGIEELAKFGWTPLIFAARNGHAEAVKELILAGADVSTQDHHGSTALHRAAFHGSVRVIEPLIDAGASLETVRSTPASPRLQCASPSLCLRVSSLRQSVPRCRADRPLRPDAAARCRGQRVHGRSQVPHPSRRLARRARRPAHRRHAA